MTSCRKGPHPEKRLDSAVTLNPLKTQGRGKKGRKKSWGGNAGKKKRLNLKGHSNS